MKESRHNSQSLQAGKSTKMRNAIMEATLECYIKFGYSGTTVMKIAEAAGVSRGALTHHFDSRHSIIEASTLYLADKRLEEFNHLLSYSAVNEDRIISEESFKDALDALWSYFHLPSYIAFQELLIAARTDEVLNEVMAPLRKTLDKRTMKAITSLFPGSPHLQTTQRVLADLYFYTLQGMVINPITTVKTPRVKNLLTLLAKNALSEYQQST